MKRVYFTDKAACTVGVSAAILLQHLFEQTKRAKESGENFYVGRYWYPASVAEWTVEIPYMTAGKIRGALKKLIDEGYVTTGNYNVNRYDRTIWYAVTDVGCGLVM